MWLDGTLDPIHIIWVVATTLVVMQPDARASYRRDVERIAGTFAGVLVAWVITVVFHAPVVIRVCICWWLRSFPITLPIVIGCTRR